MGIKKIFLNNFLGGLNDVVRGDQLKDNELQECFNYEFRENGDLYKRTEPDTYESGLNTLLSSTFDTVLVMSEPFYPQTLKSDMSGEFILFFFGEKAGAYKLYAFYKNLTSDWTASEISITGIEYSGSSDMRIHIGEDRVIFTDGVNVAHYYLIDYDGNAVSGKLGIPAPLNKADVEQITEWNPSDWEENSTNTYISEPGLFQCVYTVVTKDGEESNPSPVSETLDLQFFKLSSGEDARWIDRVRISNLIIPEVSDDIKEKLKYFNIYIRIIKYSAGSTPKSFEYSQRFEIIDKDSTGLITGNSYTVTVPPTLAEYPSYENDVAPVAKLAVQQAGVIMLGNVKKKIKFPWDFEYYCEIKLNNLDNKTYIDAVVRIRIYCEDGYPATGIENLTSTDYQDAGDLKNTEYIRIFDSDLTTPINTVVGIWAAGVFEIYVKIPQLEVGSSHSIYLCWVTAANMSVYEGVPSTYNIAEYGKWIYDDVDWSEQTVFNNERVDNFNYIICSPVINQFEDTAVSNKANTENDGVFSDTGLTKILYDNESLNNLPDNYLLQSLDGKSIIFHPTTTEELVVVYDNLTISEIPKIGTVIIRYKIPNVAFVNPPGLFAFVDNVGASKLSIVLHDTGTYWELRVRVNATDYDTGIHATGTENLLVLSWDGDDISLFGWNSSNGWEYYNTAASLPDSARLNLDKIVYGGYGYSIDDMRVGGLRVISDLYYDANNTEDKDTVYNIANFLPPFETMIGYKYSNPYPVNHNITFEDSIKIESKEYKNMVVWSNLNGVNFPDLNNKRVKEPINGLIAAPSFLKYQYENTVIIFTRNSIHRFVLSGTPEGWRVQTESLAEQFKQVALMAPKSLVKVKDILFWLSEIGVVKWSPEELRIISRNRIDININENAVAFFNPIRNQYIISNGSLTTKYTY